MLTEAFERIQLLLCKILYKISQIVTLKNLHELNEIRCTYDGSQELDPHNNQRVPGWQIGKTLVPRVVML